MAIGAHPDDIEFMMAGTLLRLGEAGWDLHVMNVADGACGAVDRSGEEIAALRLAEAREAARRLGATHHPPIARDLLVVYGEPTLARLAAVVRSVSPSILLVPSPEDYMEDHVNTSRLAVTAAFVRGMPNFRTEPPTAPVQRELVLYHAMPHGLRDPLRRLVRPGQYVEITDMMDRKQAALEAHASQAQWLDTSQGVGSYVEAMVEMARAVGRMSGVFHYAEGWRRHLHLGFAENDRDILAEALGSSVALDDGYEERLDAGLEAQGA
jgi:LmbE family N-acetylglucosaminyl deacetylase